MRAANYPPFDPDETLLDYYGATPSVFSLR